MNLFFFHLQHSFIFILFSIENVVITVLIHHPIRKIKPYYEGPNLEKYFYDLSAKIGLCEYAWFWITFDSDQINRHSLHSVTKYTYNSGDIKFQE